MKDVGSASGKLRLMAPSSLAFWFALAGFFGTLLVVSLVLHISLMVAPAIVLAIAAFAFLKRPMVLLGLLVVARMSLDYLSQTKRLFLNDQWSLSLSQLLGLFLVAMSIGLFVLYRDRLRECILWRPIALLIAFGLASSLVSIAPLTSLQEIARLVSIFSIGFLAYLSVQKASDVKTIFLLVLLSSALPFLTAVYQFVMGIGIADSSFDVARIFGTFAHPNVLALYSYSIAVTCALLFFWPNGSVRAAISARHTANVWLIAYALFALLLLMLTFTRIAWIAAFLFILALALYRYRVLLFPLILFPIVLVTFSEPIRERVMESFETNPDSSIIWRQEIWRDVTAKLALDNKKWVGTGLDTFTEYAENLRGVRFGSTDAHNDFVKFYVEGGYVGLVVFIGYLLMLAAAIRSLFGLPLIYRPLVILFSIYATTMFLASFSDNVYKDTPLQWVFYILLGALLGLKALSTKKA